MREYLVMARGDQALIFERYAGRDLVFGDGEEIGEILRSVWDEKDRASRFHEGHFDACNLTRVTRLQKPYYYVVDFC